MRVRIEPTRLRGGEITVPGDKSIAHRWLILATLANGSSEVTGLPPALDVASTAACLAAVAPPARERLSAWARSTPPDGEVRGFTWDGGSGDESISTLRVEGEGWGGITEPAAPLDCGNSGTTMRLLMGVIAGAGLHARLVGDESLSRRPMERVAEPLRLMGAVVETSGGTSPVELRGSSLRGIRVEPPVASSQVKSAILLAGLRAEGSTTVAESLPTRDHTERALRHLGADVSIEGGNVTVRSSELPKFRAVAPGDPSSAAFPLVAAALAEAPLIVRGVGLNPTRTAFLDVLRSAGLAIEHRVGSDELGEPVGEIELAARTAALTPVELEAGRFPSIADEIPVLAVLAAFAEGESRFAGAAELRVKESDRLAGIVGGLRALGGDATVEGDDLIVSGSGGLRGGRGDAGGDHRLAMALAVAATAAQAESEIGGMESAAVSYPGFVDLLTRLGAKVSPA
jgi:3-phosphoshikimate 1-carboxyvinyltransferase